VPDGVDYRRFNHHVCNEVCAVFTLNADHSFPLNEMVVKERGKNLLILKNTDRRLESFTCPMFYPAGTSGWSRDMLLQTP